jgi:hypothetical protein
MLTANEARELARQWRERFIDESAFELSWSKYFETATVPDQTRLEAWLAKDLAKDEIKHAGIVKEPLLPTRSRHQLSDCPVCWSDEVEGGLRFVRHDVDRDHPDFGKAFPCPACSR